ncbi:protein phosphatase 1 regulatory subunit Sds22p [Monosporozyma servazzii]
MSSDNKDTQDTEKPEENQIITRGVDGITMEEIPDDKIEYLSADEDLTADLPDDTDTINLIHLKIRALEDLNLIRFTKLNSLCLRQNLIESISEVDSLPVETMEDLDFYDNRIKHISKYVNKLVHLKSLDLSFNNIKHIKNIDKLTELENLYFVQNKIDKIEGLNSLHNLKNLELGGNGITQIEPGCLDGLDKLEEIWLGKNYIPRLINLNPLKSLKILSIQSNKLHNIEGLEELTNLEELYLSHNFISSIEGLENNTKLNTLDITSNRLTKLDNLSHLTELTDIWASFNKIDQSFESLGKELGSLPKLETIYLEGNPIQLQNETSYRRKLILNLGPSLQKIDATYITG